MKKGYGAKKEYTLEDLDCQYCLYHQKSDKPCQLDVCCCTEEKSAALWRAQNNTGKRSRLSNLLRGTVNKALV